MKTTIRTSQTTVPLSHYWDLVKDMDNGQKLELVSMLIDSMKPVVARASEIVEEEASLPPYTSEEIDAMLDEAEAAFEAGEFLTNDEVFHHYKEPAAV